MELRCKIFRAAEARLLEEEINHFLSEELPGYGESQFEEITQSEGPHGVTVVVWYSILDRELLLDEAEEGPEELEELDEVAQPKELA